MFDVKTLVIYVTVLPVHFIFLKIALAKKNLLLTLFMTLFFISHGIGSLTFFWFRKDYSATGYRAIGNFDFSFNRFYEAYSYIFTICLFVTIFCFLFDKHKNISFLSKFVKSEVIRGTSSSKSYSIFPIFIVAVLFAIISFWMYDVGVGMIGLHNNPLPFHLAGILFYARRLLFTIVLLFLFLKTKDKQTAALILVVYAFIVGITGTSKSISLLLLLPTILILFIIQKINIAYIVIVLTLFLYEYIGISRNVVYDTDASISFAEILNYTNNRFVKGIADGSISFFDLLNSICDRFYGPSSTVLTYQYPVLRFDGLASYYFSLKDIGVMVPDAALNLYGIVLPDDKAYGVSFGLTGTLVLLSCHNYLYTIMQAFIISILFVVQNNTLQNVFSTSGNRLHKYITLGISVGAFLIFMSGHFIAMEYLATIVLYFYSGYRKKKQLIHSNKR